MYSTVCLPHSRFLSNLDDGVFAGRDKDGVLVANASQFPSGIKALADAVHAAGFKFGIYTDRGTKTCGGRPGSLGHEQLDASTFAAIGVDFLKEDSCYADDTPEVAWPQYAKMRDALNATGRPIYFNLCGWHSWYAPVGAALGNSWRTGGDDVSWLGILSNIDIASQLAQYASPGAIVQRQRAVGVCAAAAHDRCAGAFNDPDYLLFQDASGKYAQTAEQTRLQFSVYAMLAAPLIISQDLARTQANPFVLQTLLNKEVIAVDQDVLGIQGTKIMGGNFTSCASEPACVCVWIRRLDAGRFALLFANAGTGTSDYVAVTGALLAATTGLSPSQTMRLRDLWAGTDVTIKIGDGFLSGTLGPAAVEMHVMTPVF